MNRQGRVTVTNSKDERKYERGERGLGYTKMQRLDKTRTMLYTNPDGMTAQEIADALGVTRQLAFGYIKELDAIETGRRGRYTLLPTAEDAELARAILNRWRAVEAAQKVKRDDDSTT